MAKFVSYAMDDLQIPFDKMARLTPADLLDILRPGAELMRQAIVDAIQATFTQRSGDLAGSWALTESAAEGNAEITIEPLGVHSKNGRGIRKKKRKKSGGDANAVVAYALEYGTPRIAARHYIQKTTEDMGDEAAAAMQEAMNQKFEQLGL